MDKAEVPTKIKRPREGPNALSKIKNNVKITLGLHRGGWSLHVFSDDRFLVSYPRSGNTWTRFLTANLLFPDREVSFLNIDHLIPDVLNVDRRTLAGIPRPRLIKSHEYFDPRYRRVIYIVRDP